MENNNEVNNVLDIRFNVSEEQLTNRILERIETNIANRVFERVEQTILKNIQGQIDENLIPMVSTKTENVIRKFVEDIYSNTAIQIPKKKGYYSDTVEFESYVLKDYVLKQIHHTLENGNYISSNNKISLEAYLKQLVEKDIIDNAKKVVEKEAIAVRKDVDNALKTTFDAATKQALSEQVFNVLMASDTYKKVESGIKLLQSNP